MTESRTLKRLYRLLTTSQRRTVFPLIGFMFIGMALEMLGIGFVIPAISLITQPEKLQDYPAIVDWLEQFGPPTHVQLVISGMLILVGLYIIKTLFLTFLVWKQNEFVFNVHAGLSQRLFTNYMLQPWTFHLQRNSAQLIRNMTTEIHTFTHNALLPGMLLITECLVLGGISALLIVVEPLGSLVVITVLGIAALGLQLLTRGPLLRWGEARQYHEGQRIQHLQQGLGGMKDAKLLGRQADFLNQYSVSNLGSAHVAKRQMTLQQLPRLWLELVAVSGLATLVLVMVAQNKSVGALLPTLGLFTAAAFRILPSVNRVLTALQHLRYGLPVIKLLDEEIRSLEHVSELSNSDLLTFDETISLDHIYYYYPDTETPALEDISLTIPKNTSVGFVGGSGAGKSTLIDLVLGLIPPSSGTIDVDGVSIAKNLRGWQDQIGYVPQFIFLTDDTLRHNVAFGLAEDQIDDEAVSRALHIAQLEQFVQSLTQGINTIVGERGVRLSGGQRQRIGIARALYHDPTVLILDEATSALDTATEKELMGAVNAMHGEKTLLIVAHRLSTVSNCDQLFRLENGRLVDSGTFSTVSESNYPNIK